MTRTPKQPSAWWVQNEARTFAAMCKHGPPSLPGFPKPGSTMYAALEMMEVGEVKVAELGHALGYEDTASLRTTLVQMERIDLVSRVRHGFYTLAPLGEWWLGFQRAVAA